MAGVIPLIFYWVSGWLGGGFVAHFT